MGASIRYIGVCAVVLLSGACSFTTTNKDVARVEREVETLQDQVYALQKANDELVQAVEALKRRGGLDDPGDPAVSENSYTPRPGSVSVREERRTVRPQPEAAARSFRDIPSTYAPGEKGGDEDAVSEEPMPPAAGRSPEATPEPLGVTRESPDPDYTQGIKALNLEDFKGAISSLEAFIRKSPDSRLADNAQFFIAEAYLRAENYPQAIVEFNRVIDLYPDGDAVPEALYKIGVSYAELNDKKNAAQYYHRVLNQYPDSSAAFSARRSLKQIE